MKSLRFCAEAKEFSKELAKFINDVRSLEPYPELIEPVEEWRISLWSSLSSYRPEQFVLLTAEDRIRGYLWAWVSDNGLGNASLLIDKRVSEEEKINTIKYLLSAAKISLRFQGSGPMVEVRAGGLRGDLVEVFKRILTPHQEVTRGYLMTLTKVLNVPKPKDIRLEVVQRVDKGLAKEIAEVFNSAFSIYNDYSRWDPEDAYKYYDELFRRRKPAFLILAIKKGEVVGFIESYVHRNLLGGLVGYHSLLAVKRKHQGRGIGSALLAEADNLLRKLGAKITYLHAEPKASDLYLKLGFKVEDVFISFRTLLDLLPDTISSVVLERRTKCFSKD